MQSAFYSIVSSMKGHFASAAIAIYYSVIADTLDGRIARVTNTQTDFGAEYDSLADIVAFRLARFNTQLEVTDKSYFQGLPCPSAAAMLAAFIWLGHQFHLRNSLFTFGCALLMVLGSMFMVSNIRYYSFKEIDFKGKVPFLYLLFLVILFVLVAAYPACILFITFTTYAFSGPIQTLIQKHRMRLKRKKGPNRRKPFKP